MDRRTPRLTFGGLTNEVQRRAKRVRCNAGLGCWCPLAACWLRSPGVSAALTPCGVRGPDDRSSADVSEGADVGTTNLGRAPLRVGALVVGAPWLRNRVTARRGCWWLRARLPRRARRSDAADTPTMTPSRGRRSGCAVCDARDAAAEPVDGHEAFNPIGLQNESSVRARTALARAGVPTGEQPNE